MRDLLSRRDFTAGSALAVGALLGFDGWARVWRPVVLPQGTPWIPNEELLARIPILLGDAGVSAVSMGVVDAGRVAWTRAVGTASANGGAPVDATSLFEAASLTKPVLAYVVLRLRDRGQLDIDRPLADYLAPPELVADVRAREITARHVLSHSSGFANWRFQATDQLRTAFAPGSQFSYSGEGYYWLQRVVETVTGESLASYVSATVFAPFGMRDSRLTYARDLDRRLVSAHDADGAPLSSYGVRLGRQYAERAEAWGRPVDRWLHADRARALEELGTLPPLPVFMSPNAAGSLITTAPDYALFLSRLMVTAPENDRGLAAATLSAMLTPHVRIRGPLSWGLGWGLEQVGENLFGWHWGDNVHFKAFTLLDVPGRRALVLFTNGENGERVYRPIVSDILGRPLEAFSGV